MKVTVLYSSVWIPRMLTALKREWRDREQKRAPLPDYGLKVTRIPTLRVARGDGFCRWDGLFFYLAVKNHVLKAHREQPFDVVFGSGLFPGADTATRISRLVGIPSVGLAIGSDVNVVPNYSKSMHRHYVRVLCALDGLLANGDGVAKNMEAASGRTTMLADGVVDLNLFRPVSDKLAMRRELACPETRPILLFAGYIKKEKGVFELVDALARVREKMPEVYLIVCGQGAESVRLASAVEERGLSNAVRLAGQVGPNEVRRWMQASDLFVLPSYQEGMPNAVMEAMACGLPVVSTIVGGLPAAVGDSGGAILVEPRASRPLAEAILEVLSDPHHRQEMSKAARATAVAKFDVEKNVRQLITYLSEVLAKYKLRCGG